MTTKSHKTNPADKVEQWPIDKLIPYAKNSRTHKRHTHPLQALKMSV